MERGKSYDVRGKTLEVFFWPLRAAAAEAQFPFPWKGWPKARVGASAEAVRPLLITRNSDAHITTPPFGHPFLKKKGNWGCAGTTVPWREISYGSLMEVFCELQTACDLEYITTEQFESLRPQFTAIAKMLSGLRNTFQNKITKTPLPDNSITNNL